MSPMPLPIDARLDEIVEALRTHSSLILTATPGAGKTTRLPPKLLNVVPGKIALLEPRRMATVAACHRVAEECGWTVGEEVGYQVRFESRMSARTRLVFMTDALFLRRMIDDPELGEWDMVVIDEFHERNLNQDLILGCLRELQELGSPIKILIMSATLDVAALADFLPESTQVEVPGKVFPLEIRYSRQSLLLQTDFRFFERVGEAIRVAARETEGDILVFLPGTGEITRTQNLLAGSDREIVPLHGSLPLAEQRRALMAPTRPRIILATNVAEASVTVQGVDCVIDTGLAKVMEMNPSSGFSSLELKRISLFNAQQRAGRAARQKAGVCYRLWTVHEETTQAQEMIPEAQRTDLSSALLWLAHFGVSDFANFAWLDRPPEIYLNSALRALLGFAALDRDRRLTDLGRRLIRYPLPPRWGALLAEADAQGMGETGAEVAAVLAERDFAERGATTQMECDVLYRLSLLEDLSTDRRASGVNVRAARETYEASRQLTRLLENPTRVAATSELEVRRLLLLSQKDRLCRRRAAGSERALMVGGRGVRLSPDSQVRQNEFFVALAGVDLPGQNETQISLASGFSKVFVIENLKSFVQTEDKIEYVEEKSQFFNRRVRTLFGLPLEEPTLTQVDAGAIGDRLSAVLIEKWDWLVQNNERLGQWMERWNFFARLKPENAQHLSAEHIAQGLALAAFGKTKMNEVIASDLVSYLEMGMDAAILCEFHHETPEKFQAPSGHAHRIHYEDRAAYVDVRLQEIFGLLASPLLANGKVPLTFRLLGPNYRPVQVTSDLANFWKKGYVEVRKELRARYPKHSWPDDPLTAKPEAKGRRRT